MKSLIFFAAIFALSVFAEVKPDSFSVQICSFQPEAPKPTVIVTNKPTEAPQTLPPVITVPPTSTPSSGNPTTIEPSTTTKATTTNDITSSTSEPTTTNDITSSTSEPTTTNDITSSTSEPTTTSDITSSTSEPTTTNDITSSTSEPTTTNDITSSTSEPTTTNDITSSTLEPTTTNDITSSTSEPTTTNDITSSTLEPTTTNEISSSTSESTTTQEATTESVTTQEATTEAVTTQEATTESVTTQEATTEAVTTQEATTEAVTTQEATTEAATTQEATTEAVTTQEATTEAATTQEATTEAVTTQEATTEAATTQEATTEAATTQEATTEAATTTPAAKRVLLEYEDWPQEVNYTTDEIKGFALKALEIAIEKAELNSYITVISDNIDVELIKDSTVYMYNITYNVNVNEEKKGEWQNLKDHLTTNNHTEFYQVFNESTGGNYSTCSAPTHLRIPTQCKYEKYIYEYEKDKDSISIKPEIQDGSIKYTVNCESNEIKGDNEGNITGNTSKTTDYITCSIKCDMKEDKEGKYRSGYTMVTVKVTDKQPKLNKVLSSVPSSWIVTNIKSATIVLQYPSIVNKNEKKEHTVKVELSANQGNCKLNGTTELIGVDQIKFYDLYITCDRHDGLIDGKLTFTVDNNNDFNITKTIKITPIPEEQSTALPTVNKDEVNNETQIITYESKCPAGKGNEGLYYEADINGLCCDRKVEYGESCSSITAKFPFTETVDNNFMYAYVDMLMMNAFNNTNFNITRYSASEKIITIEIKFYSKYTFSYSGDGENAMIGRLIGENNGIDFTKLSSPFVYIKQILSFVRPDVSTSGTGENQILESMPKELEEVLKGKEEEIQKLEEIKKVVEEKQSELLVKNDKFPDLNTPVTVEEEVGDVTLPTLVETVVYLPTKPTTEAPQDKESWAEKYWYAILIICIAAVLLIAIIGFVVVSLVSKNKEEVKKEKSEKIMETIIPIEKIKEEKKINDDDIYKPFSYEVIMEGYLLKEGHDRVVSKWQRRFFVLYFEPAVLRIYSSMTPSYYGKVYLDERQSIPLECYNGIEYEDGNSEFTLVLKVRDSNLKTFEPGDEIRKVHLKVEGENSSATAKKWVECFRDFKNQKPKAGDAWTKPLIVDQSNGKLTATTNASYEKKNEEVIRRFNQQKALSSV